MKVSLGTGWRIKRLLLQQISMIEAHRQADLTAQLCLAMIAILFVFILYLTFRAIFTKSDRLPSAPAHIVNATVILKWSAGMSLILSLLASVFDSYDQLLYFALSGEMELHHFASVLFNSLFLIGAGLIASFVSLLGMAMIFTKRLRFTNRLKTADSNSHHS